MVKLESDKMGKNDVIVTLYEESSRVRSVPRPKSNKIRGRNTNTRQSFGYDRRAELLARIHELRNGGSRQANHDPSPTDPTPKPKKRRRLLASLRKIRLSFGRIFGERKKRWRYESIETQGDGRKYKICCPRKRSWSNFSKFSCFWKCSKFSKNEDDKDLDSQMVDKSRVSR
ncbi:hypothetical protein vseg_004613 [Gypsophila vaccaria]